MKNRFFRIIAVAVTTAVLFIGCGSAAESAEMQTGTYDSAFPMSNGAAKSVDSDVMSESAVSADYEASEEVNNSGDLTELSDTSKIDVSERKIVYTASVSMESTKYDASINKLEELIKSSGAYSESSNHSGNKKECNRQTYYRVRVPVEGYESFMDAIEDVATVTSMNQNAEDVTSSYIDVQARIESLNRKKERLQKLEDEATQIDDLLSIETQISDVIYETERYIASLNSLKDKTSNCTVDVSLREVPEYTKPAGNPDSLGTKVVEAFFGSIYAFKAFFDGFVVVLVYLLPYLILAGIIFFIIKKLGIKSKLKDKKKKKLEEKQEKSQKDKSDNSQKNGEENQPTDYKYF